MEYNPNYINEAEQQEAQFQQAIKSLPVEVQDIAIELQDKNDELDRVKMQLESLIKESENLKTRAELLIVEETEKKAKLKKLNLYVKQNEISYAKTAQLISDSYQNLVEKIKDLDNKKEAIRLENELILQDITIINDDERKLRQEIEFLNQSLQTIVGG